jgi:hypothetical protein
MTLQYTHLRLALALCLGVLARGKQRKILPTYVAFRCSVPLLGA